MLFGCFGVTSRRRAVVTSRLPSMVTQILALVALIRILPGIQGSMHQHDPLEIDVQSESCDFNTIEGFAGDIGSDFFTVEYYYTIQVNASLMDDTEVAYKEPTNFEDLSEGSLQHVVLKVELAIASLLLHESFAFKSAPCNQGRRGLHETPRAARSLLLSAGDRRTKNVGLTIGPDDEFLAMCEVQIEGVPCYEYAGWFQVYTVGGDDNTTEVVNEIKLEIKDAMNSGELDDAHPALLSVKYLDAMRQDSADEAQTDEQDTTTTPSTIQDGPNASVIIGASVGAVILLGTMAIVRRRRNYRSLENSSEFQISQEYSGAEESQA
jgi:hypothetical protein